MSSSKLFRILKEIESLKGKILWTNENPSQSFPVKDVIKDLSEYDVIGIWFWRNTTLDCLQEVRIKNGTGGSFAFLENGTTYIQSRAFMIYQNTIHFMERLPL